MAHTFTPEETQRGSNAGVQTRTTAAMQRATRASRIATLVDYVDQGSIGQDALETSLELIAHLRDAIPAVSVDTSLDVVRLAQSATELHRLYRLETGQSTSNSAHAAIDPAALADRKAALLARLTPPDTSSQAE